MSPKFSIIIPVYNVAPYLRECLDSVLVQTFADWEAICVDDGSTDGSGAILDEYREKVEKLGGGGRRMVVIHQKNSGVSAARNAGLDVARGEWVLFLDGDDLLVSKMLAWVAKIADAFSDTDAIRFLFRAFHDGERMCQLEWNDQIVSRDVSRSVDRSDVDAYLWEFAYRRSQIGDMRFDQRFCRGEDRVFVASLIIGPCRKIVVAPSVFYYYRQRSGSAMHMNITERIVTSEFQFRMAILACVDRSRKILSPDIVQSWVGWFFAGEHIRLLEQAIGDKRSAYEMWYNCAKSLTQRNDLFFKTQLKVSVESFFKSAIVSRLLYPAIFYEGVKCVWRKRLSRVKAFLIHGRKKVGK